MRWTEYTIAMLLFSGVSMALLYLIERVQLWLPFNPQKFANLPPTLAWGTAASFTTNTNWQAYSRRIHDELFHADGRPGLPQLWLGGHGHRAGHRGDSRHRAQGNRQARKFLGGHDALPALGAGAAVRWSVALVFVSQGVIQNLKPYTTAELTEPQTVQVTGTDGKTTTQTVTEQTDRAGAGGVARSHQDAGHQRRRFFQRQ